MSHKVNKVAKFELAKVAKFEKILSVLLKSSVCLLIFGPCCLIRSASSIAKSPHHFNFNPVISLFFYIIFFVLLIHCTMTTLFSTTHANEADPVLFV